MTNSGTVSPDPTQRLGEWWIRTHGPSDLRQRDRGRSLARKGAVERLELTPGVVTGKVRHGRGRPPRATIEIRQLDDAWVDLVDAMSGEVRYTAALLAGELPDQLEAVAERAGVSLLPSPDEVESSCTCLDPDQPCIHVAALHGALADSLRDDPLLILRLRGRERERLLDDLRGARGEGEEPARSVLEGVRDPFAARDDLDAVVVHPTPVDDPAMLFAHLGEPPGVDATAPFEAVIARTAETAWRLASGAGAEVADDEVLLAELRAQRFATAGSVADALGWDEERARQALDRMFEEGDVLRTGSGEEARYRAASS